MGSIFTRFTEEEKLDGDESHKRIFCIENPREPPNTIKSSFTGGLVDTKMR